MRRDGHEVTVAAPTKAINLERASSGHRLRPAFSTPLGISESVGAAVADAVRVVRASGLPNETNAMVTNVEGEWDEVMNLIKWCVIEVSRSAPRVIKVDYRPGAVDALQATVATVESHLAEE